ncbi:MAG TPA: SDR family NAD(P)-dependent oxidoreductase [Burkholderiales bacterium]|jgi:NAD(P)-dependent dehydrogenase (short-subunit alcohol dehydrogenase family)
MSKRVEGLVAIVTAAGAGLGEAIAKTLGAEGASVAVADFNHADAQRVAGEISAAGSCARAFEVDATRAASVQAMADAAIAQWGRVDILVNCAGGFTKFTPIADTTEEDWDHVIALNLKSAFLCSRAVAKGMMERKSGRIINITSGAGIMPNPFAPTYVPYAAGKAGMIGFTKALASELGPHKVTVNAVAPGTALTPRVRKVRDAASIEKIASQNPLRAIIEPQDCADAVLFLASKEARMITGEVLKVNAGNLM